MRRAGTGGTHGAAESSDVARTQTGRCKLGQHRFGEHRLLESRLKAAKAIEEPSLGAHVVGSIVWEENMAGGAQAKGTTDYRGA